MNATEETVRDFVGYLQGQCPRPPEWKDNLSLIALEITNNSANDYYRSPTEEEVERLISGYLSKCLL
jgi:hypothetical protein